MEWSNNFEISFSCEIDSTKDLFKALFNDNRYDVIMTDNDGNSVELKNKKIENNIKVTRRIPRKMKKMIKMPKKLIILNQMIHKAMKRIKQLIIMQMLIIKN